MSSTGIQGGGLQPRGIGEILDAAFKVVLRNFKPLAICVLVVAVPLGILRTLITASTADGAYDYGSPTVATTSGGSYYAGLLVVFALTLVATSLASAACLRIVGADVLGGEAAAGESLRTATGRLGGLVGVGLLYGLCIVLGLVCLVLPGIWVAVAASLATPALFFERIGPWAAIRRSTKLLSGMWWRTFAILLVLYILVTILQTILSSIVVAALLSNSDNQALNALLETIVVVFSQVATLPLIASAIALIYFDARVRKEGFDLQLLASRIGHDAPAAPVAEASSPSGGFLAPESPRDW